jgi:serine/threonine protein kinase
MTGRTVSHYRALEKLGAGGIGVVYKAQDLKLDRMAALKFLPPHPSADPQQKNHPIRAGTACALDHAKTRWCWGARMARPAFANPEKVIALSTLNGVSDD